MSETTAPVAARPASTILLLRDGPSGLETFMVVRHHQIDFASGALVFPGGRMEAADVELGRRARAGRPARAFKVAAIREAFEECGVLLARPEGEDAFVPAARSARSIATAPFADLMAREKLVPALDALVPFAHWITPDFVPKRFDTHFFLALAPADQALAHDGREAVGFGLDIAAGGAGRARKALQAPVPDPPEPVEARRPRDAASALAAARAAPVVTVMPEKIMVDGGPGLKIPAEAGYGGEAFSVVGLL